MDNFLVMLRSRVGWQYRDILTLRTLAVRRSRRPHFHPGLQAWPLEYTEALNTTRRIQADWAFLSLARQQEEEQRLSFGERRLDLESALFRGMLQALVSACDPLLGDRGGVDVAIHAAIRQAQMRLACDEPKSDCRSEHRLLTCMLQRYDSCKAGTGPKTFCDYHHLGTGMLFSPQNRRHLHK